MFLIDIIPLTKIPHAQPQVLSYFFGVDLAVGALVEIPLGRRKEVGAVLASRPAAEYKQAIKKAAFELKNISRVIAVESVFTEQQIQLALFLGQYYFTSPGMFLKNVPDVILNEAQRSEESNKRNRQALILAPTISLAQKISSEHKNSALWHSDLTKKQQREIWQKVKNGEAETIIGTRSAVFLPFTNLKEIIIEDAANPSHRSWDMRPRYSAITAARKLAEIFKCRLKIKNTPLSIELWNILKNKKILKDFCHPELDSGSQIIDLRAEFKAGNFSIFSRTLQTAIKGALAKKQPIILFINRRGAANFVLCRDCGYVAKCQNCDAPLAYHLVNNQSKLLCHRCGYQEKPPSLCPQCQSYNIKTVGSGSQKVEAEARKLFSASGRTQISRLDSDNASKSKDQQKIINDYAAGKIDILVVTPMLFSWLAELRAKPPLVIGLINADALLHLPDFQSGERTWQTITMLRTLSPSLKEGEKKKGCSPLFIIQTYNPENPIIQFAATGDWQKFYDDEIETRKLLNYPPFSQIVKLVFRHRDPKRAGQEAKILAAKLTRFLASYPERNGGSSVDTNHIQISVPLPAFIPKQKGQYVWNIIIKFLLPKTNNVILSGAKNLSEFLQYRNSLLQYIPQNWEIDIDPIDLL